MDDAQITYIGKTDFRNKMTTFGIKAKDREKHMYIIGKTGTGKSTFLENMIVQDIQNGNGVAFIDPHGSSAEKLLDYIPEWRLDDVIYFNPSDFEFPIAFNPLEDPGPDKRHLIADGLMSVFKKVWPDAFSGRMEYILNNTMLSLLEYPDSTVLSINRMLTDKDFRKKVVAATTDSAVRNAWDELMKWDDKRWSEAVAALINKVGQFSTNPVIRNIVGQPKSTFDFRKAMDERKIIIINLSKGMIGEQNAPLLGAMLITKIYLAAMSRAELSASVMKMMPPFYFYVDEFQNFANESFASILSEARKYKLALTVANQFIAQMEETIRDAVFGNMGTTAAFRVGPLDAEFMEKVFAPVFDQESLQNIQFGQYYLTLQIDGMGSKPFSAQGLGPIAPLSVSMREQVIEKSRINFGRPKKEVEDMINNFFGYDQKFAKVISSTGSSQSDQKAPAYVRPAAQVIPKKQDFFKKPQEVKKPLPEITGFKKPAPSPKTNPVSVTVAPKQKPAVPSQTLQDLLNKFDDVVVEPTKENSGVENTVVENTIVIATPAITAPRVEKKLEEPIPVSVPTQQIKKSPDLSRAASPEKKSALAEALAKAMAGKTPVVSPEPVAPVEEKKEVPVSEIQQPKPQPDPVIAPPVPPVKNQEQHTTREVPEDILRRALE